MAASICPKPLVKGEKGNIEAFYMPETTCQRGER